MQAELFKARVRDTAELCRRTESVKYLGFLSVEEAVFADRLLRESGVRYFLFGGYESAERVMLGCFPEWVENFSFPITAITFNYRQADILSHRDFLGSLMALGIKRETVGDILVTNGRAVAFVTDEISDYILSQIEKIGSKGVTVKKGYCEPLPEKSQLKEFSKTISSDRLDCVASALAGVSRAEASQKIAEGMVSINSQVFKKPTKAVAEGDIVTFRGKGKFYINSLCDKTKKDRIILRFKKFI